MGVCGSVGAGKSSLLSAILGEVSHIRGDPIRVDIPDGGSIAYCSQAPWIIAGSVKENIEFGQERGIMMGSFHTKNLCQPRQRALFFRLLSQTKK